MQAKTVFQLMRSLHRDIGYLVIGFTLIFALSGVVLIYRDTGFLKTETSVEKQLPANLTEHELGRELHMKRFKAERSNEETIWFANGTYNRITGEAQYTEESLPALLEKMVGIHKQPSKGIAHLFSLIYGILLLFLAVSSFWMFRPGSKRFKRSMTVVGVGFVLAIVSLLV